MSELRAELSEQALGMLSRAARRAINTLVALLEADSESVRLGAARALLEALASMRRNVELETRIEALEKIAEAQGRYGSA